MKPLFLLPLLILLASCGSSDTGQQQMQAKIDSLQKKLDKAYRPGLGEFMLGIQLHHAKLWFAGKNQNWKLADFEVHEIGESLDDIKQYCTDRPEVKSIGRIDEPIANINEAIKQKDMQLFNKSFIELTATCNNCHKDTQHEFNVVTIPTNLPVVNQEFKPAK